MAGPLKIGLVASEAVPYAKTGGLADVAGSLPPRLAAHGHDARLFVPLHRAFAPPDVPYRPLEGLRDVPVQLGARTLRFDVVAPPETACPVYLIDCPELFDRPSIYSGDEDDAWRFTFLARATIETAQRLAWAPDVLHCNDWHTALIPLLLRTIYEWDALFRGTRTLLTIHNLGYQGLFGAALVEALGLGAFQHLLDQDDLRQGRVNFLRTGLVYADAVSTVSPTYAREIQHDELGMGLQHVLRARRSSVVGILNGVDYGEWDPAADPWIPRPFSRDVLDGKLECKRHLVEQLRLEVPDRLPLLGIVSRLVVQKGFDLCFEVLPELIAGGHVGLVVLGSGERRYEEFFERLQQAHPLRVCFHRGYHDELAHVIQAACDLQLMPSRYEPCGLNQMFGMRYGTLPIVRRTGGLADTVEPIEGPTGTGTGFVFEHFTADGLRWAIGQALAAWADPPRWRELMRGAMERDFSWDARVPAYVELYTRLLDR